MTNTRTTTKTNRYCGAALSALAMLAAMLVASGVALAAAATFGNPSTIQILDNARGDTTANPYPSQIKVQNLSGNITDVNVQLSGFGHSFPDDVDVLLEGPRGQKTLLMSDVGGGDSAFNVNLTFDDEATNSLSDSSLITAGTYRPTQGTPDSAAGETFPSPAPAGPYTTYLSAFDNTNPNGTWDLYVLDDHALDAGQFAGGWSLEITTDSPDPDTTAPRVKSTTPRPGATGVSPTANIAATFSEDIKAATVNATTFELFRKGSTTKVGATVRYDATADRATLDPTDSLKRGATYKAIVTTDTKDPAGNRLDQNPSRAGNQPKVWRFTVRR
jgi:subtilisin-like proprotein convertase family protein